MDEKLIKNLSSIAELAFKGLIYGIKNKKVSANSTYKNFKTLKFNIKLPTNQCFNWSSVHYLSSDSNKKKTNSVNNTDATMMTINNFFAHQIKEINIKRYGDDLQILATGKSTEIYRYSNAILKYMLKDALKTFIKTLLNSKDDVQVFHGCNRSPHNTNDNLTNRLAKFTMHFKKRKTKEFC